MSKGFNYYATNNCLRKIFLEIESAIDIKYVKVIGFHEKNEQIPIFNSVSEIFVTDLVKNSPPNFPAFNIYKKDRALYFFGRETYKGKLCYDVYEPNGQNSVCWHYGGEYEEKSVGKGTICIVEETSESEEIYRIIKNAFSRNCAIDRGFFVSPDLLFRKDEFRFDYTEGKTYPLFRFLPNEKSARISQKLKKAYSVEMKSDYHSVEYDDYDNALKTLETIIDINRQDNNGMTYLMHAIQGENYDVAKKLLEKGADPNIPDNRGFMPLSYLLYFEEDFLQFLIDYGANIDLQINDGPTIRDYFESSKQEEYKMFLNLPFAPQKLKIGFVNQNNYSKADGKTSSVSSDTGTINSKEPNVMIENGKKLTIYKFKNNWSIEFPTDWSYEIDEEDKHNIFYPPDSELTIRISELFTNAKEDDLKEIYKESVPSDSKQYELGFNFNFFNSLAYETVEYEHDLKVYRFIIGCYKDGFLLSINIYALDRNECIQALKYIKTIKTNDESPKCRLSLFDKLRG